MRDDDEFGVDFDRAAKGAGTRVLRAAIRVPLMNGFFERFQIFRRPRSRMGIFGGLFLCSFLPSCGGSESHCAPAMAGNRFDIVLVPSSIPNPVLAKVQIDITTESGTMRITCSDQGCSGSGSLSNIQVIPELQAGSLQLADIDLIFVPAPETISVTLSYGGARVAERAYTPACMPKIVTTNM